MPPIENTQENLAALRALLKRMPQRDWESILGASNTGGAGGTTGASSNKQLGASKKGSDSEGTQGPAAFLILQPAFQDEFLPGEAIASESDDNTRLPTMNMGLRQRLNDDAVKVSSWRWGVETIGPGTEGGNWASGVAQPKEFHFDIEFDAATIGMLRQILNGGKFHRVAVFCCQSVNISEVLKEFDYYLRIDLWDAWLTSIDMNWGEGRALPTLSVDFQFWNIEFRYRPVDRATHEIDKRRGTGFEEQFYQWYPQAGKSGGHEQDNIKPDFDKE